MAQPVTIEFWDLQWGNADYQVVSQALVDQFNAEHPDIQVNLTIVPWTNWFETFVTAVASGSAPDVSTGASFQPNYFYDQDAILPLDDMIAGDAGRRDAGGHSRRRTSKPITSTVTTSPFRGPSTSPAGTIARISSTSSASRRRPRWDEFRAAAKAVTGDGVYGVISYPQEKILITMFQNNGGGFFTEDGKPDMLGERNRETVEYLAALVADGSVDPGSTGYDGNQAMQAFLSGKGAFFLWGPALLPNADAETQAKIGLLLANDGSARRQGDCRLERGDHGLQPDTAPEGNDGVHPLVVGAGDAAVEQGR